MQDFLYPLTPLTDFRKLGTGHKRRLIVAVNMQRRIVFVARVLNNNFYTSKTVRFDNGKVFFISSETVRGEKVQLFFWTEKLEREWQKQCEADVIENWMKSAAPRDIFAFLECVASLSGMTAQKYAWDILSGFAKAEISKHLEVLSMRELRQLTSLLTEEDYRKAA